MNDDRVTDLLTRQAERHDVPHLPAEHILGRGRTLRRRRRTAVGITAVVALTASIFVAGSLRAMSDQSSAPGFATATPASSTWAVASGSQIQLSDGVVARVDGTVSSVYYTSAGVLARTGATSDPDEGESHYSLVLPDGSVDPSSLALGDRVPGTDPTLPYLAYATATDDPEVWDVVLRDVTTGDEVTRVPVEGSFTWGGWVAPPVDLDGDQVYVGLDDATTVVDWRTGEIAPSDALGAARMPVVEAGRANVDVGQRRYLVVDARTGETVARGPLEGAALLSLAPDGAHGVPVPWRTCDDDGCVFDERTTRAVDLDTGSASDGLVVLGDGFGWTPTGDVLSIDGDEITACDPDTDTCQITDVLIDDGDLRLGGSFYGS